MVDWTQPVLSTQYAQVLTDLDDRLDELAIMFAGTTSTNIPTGAIQIDTADLNKLLRYGGATWDAMDLTITGAFTSLGIDDNATAERFQLTDTSINIAATSVDFTFQHAADDAWLSIRGGIGSNAAYIVLHGSADPGSGSDMSFRSYNSEFFRWDESAGAMTLSTGTGTKSAALTLSSTQNATFAGDVLVEGLNFTIGDAGTNTGVIKRGRTDASLNIGAGTGVNNSMQITMFGSTHASQAYDLLFRRGGSTLSHFDDSTGIWTFSSGSAGSLDVALTLAASQDATFAGDVIITDDLDLNGAIIPQYPGAINIDTTTTPGMYAWSNVTMTGTMPSWVAGASYGHMWQISDGSQDSQMWWGGTNTERGIAIRRKDAGSWGAWMEFIHNDPQDLGQTIGGDLQIDGNVSQNGSALAVGTIKTTTVTVTDTTWAPTAGVRSIKFTAIGGGGGGGGIDGVVSADGCSAGGGGGAGCIKTVTTIDTTYNITIGAAGAAGAAGNNNGTAGGATTVVGLAGPGTNCDMSATGGRAGIGQSGTSSSLFRLATGGFLATGGDINMRGGGNPAVPVVTGENAGGGVSGACPIMGGGIPPTTNATGTDADIYGEGGGGTRSSTATDYAGGDGFAGVVFIEEYF